MLTLTAIILIGATAVDGDTLRASGTRYRLWGIDASERAEPGGTAATDALAALMDGQTLTCSQIDTDRYQRPVVQCFTPSGEDLACALVAGGYADDWPRYSGGFYAGCE